MGSSSRSRRAWTWTALLVVTLATTVAAQTSPPAAPRPSAGHGVRTLVLVRHGIYDETDRRDPEIGRALLPEGREQARLTGERLAAWPRRVDVVYASTMTRARETAEIIMRSLPGVPLIADRNLRECEPPGDRDPSRRGPRPGEADSCAARVDDDFARYFRPSPDRDSTEVLVCHGAVIRWLICRAMGVDPKRWLSLSVANGSLTVIEVRADGHCVINAVGDRGHLPVALQTWGMPRPAGRDSTRR
jgi:serine/threonine-protein phosphatase PGAM5